MKIINKEGRVLEATEKAYDVVYKELGYKPLEEVEQEPEEKPISKMTKAELEAKAEELEIELKSTKVDEMKAELTEKMEAQQEPEE